MEEGIFKIIARFKHKFEMKTMTEHKKNIATLIQIKMPYSMDGKQVFWETWSS